MSEVAQVFLGNQFSSRGKHDIKHDVAQIFSRFNNICYDHPLVFSISLPKVYESLERSGYSATYILVHLYLQAYQETSKCGAWK